MTKPKIDQVNTPPGVLEVEKAMAIAAFHEAEIMKEAAASCRLDGETMDCEKCKSHIEQEVARRIRAEIEKLGILPHYHTLGKENCPLCRLRKFWKEYGL